MPFSQKLKVLVAPLDWGLGHTTRCIPIIQALLEKGVEVVLTGNLVQQKILSAEFPQCRFLLLEGYEVAYSRKSSGFLWKIAQQLPRIVSVIKKENKWLQQLVQREALHGVISDNRFGLYTSKVPCVFISHQLQIKTGAGYGVDYFARRMNYRYINKYSHLWVPDFEGTENLAGQLSHPSMLPSTTVWYIGNLSRLQQKTKLNAPPHVLIVLSGPEPQRSIFEKKIFEQLTHIKSPVTIVRGTPLEKTSPLMENVTIYSHVSSQQMEGLMRTASFIVCRSGYSSVMDINALQGKSILIPTPGQTEQVYLAQHLRKKQFAVIGNQSNFNLSQLLQNAAEFAFNGFIQNNPAGLKRAIDVFLNDCKRSSYPK